jgi:hypothetical protein
MGLVASCCPHQDLLPATHFVREETITVPESKKNSIFPNVDIAQDATPLLNVPDGKMIVVSDSDSDSFDQAMIDHMLDEHGNSHGSA